MEAVTAQNITKVFGGTKRALDDISFSIQEGEVFGFLGPNGSGKTTTVKLLNGILLPTAGTCSVLGVDPAVEPHVVHKNSGVLTEHAQMYDNLTGMQNILFYAELFGLDAKAAGRRGLEILERIGLADAKDQKLASYSTGMRQRLSLARTMIHNPRILFLDEPTSGLDPESAKSVNELLKDLAADQGTTVFLCTHQLRYAQEICTRYGLVDEGVLLAEGDIDHLRSMVSSGFVVTIDADNMPESVRANQTTNGQYEVRVTMRSDIPSVVETVVNEGGHIYGVTAHELTLEEVYFALIEKQRAEEGHAHDQ